MDRKVNHHSAGFSLVELIIVVAIIGIVSIAVVTSKTHTTAVNSVNNDLHSTSLFLKRLRLQAFTEKLPIQVTVAPNQITTVVDPGGAATPGKSLTLNNSVLVTGSPFTISTRGTFSSGNIRLDYGVADPPPTGTKFSCITINNIRIRLGTINTTPTPDTCDAL